MSFLFFADKAIRRFLYYRLADFSAIFFIKSGKIYFASQNIGLPLVAKALRKNFVFIFASQNCLATNNTNSFCFAKKMLPQKHRSSV
jgi:hypothetical protein